MYLGGVVTILWYAAILIALDFFITDITLSLAGILYNFLGVLMIARVHAGPAHFTLGLLSQSHEPPLLMTLQQQINTRLKERMGFIVLAFGFFLTFFGESGMLSYIS